MVYLIFVSFFLIITACLSHATSNALIMTIYSILSRKKRKGKEENEESSEKESKEIMKEVHEQVKKLSTNSFAYSIIAS